MKILIVDDHPLIRESLAVVLADLARVVPGVSLLATTPTAP